MILRETQNQNDADDANDAESGIWYRDIPKTASLASSASLSSHKSSEGVWGTPQKCACGWPHAMLAKHVCHQNDDKQTRYPHKFVYDLQSESLLIHPKILTRKNESVLIHTAIRARVAERRKIARLRAFPVQNSLRSRHKQHGCFPEKSA